MNENDIRVAIVTGSDSDLPVVAAGVKVLEDFGIGYSVNVASAHRTPERVRELVRGAENRGVRVFIAAAGMAAALPGVVAAETVCPVIGVPLEGKALAGMDALFAIVQMPPGVPVAASAIGKAGAVNAAILAVEILAVSDPSLKEKLADYRKRQAETIADKDARLQRDGIARYVESMKK